MARDVEAVEVDAVWREAGEFDMDAVRQFGEASASPLVRMVVKLSSSAISQPTMTGVRAMP
jgi:hypothetical protein